MLYKFKGYAPQAMQQPWDGWVADNATVIGQVELGKKLAFGLGLWYVPITVKSNWVILAMFRKMLYCILMQALKCRLVIM